MDLMVQENRSDGLMMAVEYFLDFLIHHLHAALLLTFSVLLCTVFPCHWETLSIKSLRGDYF